MSRPFSCRDDSPRWFTRYPHPDLAAYIAEEGKERTFRSLGWPSWGLLYHVALTFLHPEEENTILEIGTNLGMSTIVLAQALVDFGLRGRVVTYESDAAFAAEAERRLRRAGLAGRAEVHATPFGGEVKIDDGLAFAFLDFTKNRELNQLAFDRCLAALRPGGAVLFDNSETRGIAPVVAAAEAGGLPVVHLQHASWGFWPPPETDRGGTPGMALIQKARAL